MTVRKNFIFDSEIAQYIEEIAKLDGKMQTQVVQKKLALFDEINDSFHGLLIDVDAKASRMEHAMEKYGK